MIYPDEKECLSKCPNCGAGVGEIHWHGGEWGEGSPFQSATCEKCGCEFREHYKYDITIYNEDECKQTDGKYQCGSCERYFDELIDNECPHCGSGNWVEGCIDESKSPEN